MNIKKLFPERKISRKGVMDFLDRKGFYIVLVLCIAIVGATAVFVTTHNITPQIGELNSQKLIPEESDINPAAGTVGKDTVQSSVSAAPGNPGTKGTLDKAVEKGKPAVSTNNSKQTTGQAEVKNISPSTKVSEPKKIKPSIQQKFISPVFGDVTFDYSQDKLVYSKTLEEWRTHSGIDIAADRGTPVKAVSDGVVSEVKSDPRLGIIIIIDHQNGIKTVYANLAGDDMVSTNQKIKQGDVIGCVGNTAAFESVEQAHIHFEVLKNNAPVNPTLYLPKK